jgi:hypothetical protein
VFTILGSGFGLYGYLPALFAAGETGAVLPERYREVVTARPELQALDGRITWVSDPAAALAAASGAIIAGRPAWQPQSTADCLACPNIQDLILEKPMACDPAAADALLGDLLASGRRFRLGYLFLLTPVQQMLRQASRGDGEITINWAFMAHHFAKGLDNWKRHDVQGGGALRFYGIHLIAALADCGYTMVQDTAISGETEGESERWEARFTGPGLAPCRITLDSRAPILAFEIAQAGKPVMAGKDPFDAGTVVAGQDRRVDFLAALIGSLAQDDAPFHDLYARTNGLWARTERQSRFIPRPPQA